VHNENCDPVSGLEPLFDFYPDYLCLLSPVWHFKLTNKRFKEAVGYTDEILVDSCTFFEYMHPDDQAGIITQVESLLGGENPCLFEARFRCSDGQFKWLWWNIKKLPDHTFIASARDSTDHTKNYQYPGPGPEQNIETPFEPQENYKLLFQSNPVPIVIYDVISFAVLDVNQMASELYGYTREEFIQLTIKDIRPPGEIPLIVETIRKRVFDSEIRNLGTWNHLKKTGEPIKVEVIGHSINYMGRHCMIVVCNDVTEQSKTLRSLEQSIERFEYVTEATTDIIWDWDLETNEVYYSGNIEKSFGHTPGYNVGDMRFFAKHVHHDDKERVVLYADAVKYGDMKYWTEKYRFRKANGEYAYVLDKGIVIRDEKGVGIRMIGAMQDITELKNNELHIAKQKDQLIEIAQMNAHETRRPVATILGLVNLIDKSTIKDKDTLDVLTHLDTATRELDAVIKRIIHKTVD
jgi:PAS domain S-box-containing protein